MKLFLYLLIFFLIGCSPKQEILIPVKNSNVEITINKQVSNSQVSPNLLYQEQGFDIQNFLSGSAWGLTDEGLRQERVLSWGETYVTATGYLLFDFGLEYPMFFYGGSEGGPCFDIIAGRIESMSINNNVCILTYRKIISWTPFSSSSDDYYYELKQSEIIDDNVSTLKFIFNLENDTIQPISSSEKYLSALNSQSTWRRNKSKHVQRDEVLIKLTCRIYREPNFLSAHIRVIDDQEKVYVSGRSSEKQMQEGKSFYWYKIELVDGTQGWVFGDCLFPVERIDIPIIQAELQSATDR